MKQPQQILMVSPDYFRIEYVINPHMDTQQSIDLTLAQSQWHTLKHTYESLNFKVHVLPMNQDLPDMVFAANHGLVFMDSQGQKSIALSRMAHKQRQSEVPLFSKWYKKQEYQIIEPPFFDFEGHGDVIWDYSRNMAWVGYGWRTSADIKSYLSKLPLTTNIKLLKLISPYFYHLDTCFVVCGDNCALAVREAFEDSSWQSLKNTYGENLIEVSLETAKSDFVCNAHSPDGKHVLLPQTQDKTIIDQLESKGKTVTPLKTSEFIKAGGSVFCLKMQVY